MTKEEYLIHRVNNHFGDIVYEFYKERFNVKKHNPFLSHQDVIKFLNLLGMVDMAITRAIVYYEEKWSIVKVTDSSGIIIKFI